MAVQFIPFILLVLVHVVHAFRGQVFVHRYSSFVKSKNEYRSKPLNLKFKYNGADFYTLVNYENEESLTTAKESLEVKEKAMEVLDCLASPHSQKAEDFDVAKDIKRRSLISDLNYSDLKMTLKRKGLQTQGDKLEMITRLLINQIDPSVNYLQTTGREPRMTWVNDDDLATGKVRVVPEEERVPSSINSAPDAEDIRLISRKSVTKVTVSTKNTVGGSDDGEDMQVEEEKQPKRILMDGLVRRLMKFPPQSISRTCDGVVHVDDKNVQVGCYVTGGRDVVKTWEKYPSVIVFLPDESGWQSTRVRIMADEIAFSTQAIVVVPDIHRQNSYNAETADPNTLQQWKDSLATEELRRRIFDDVAAAIGFSIREFDCKAVSLSGVGHGAGLAMEIAGGLWDLGTLSLLTSKMQMRADHLVEEAALAKKEAEEAEAGEAKPKRRRISSEEKFAIKLGKLPRLGSCAASHLYDEKREGRDENSVIFDSGSSKPDNLESMLGDMDNLNKLQGSGKDFDNDVHGVAEDQDFRAAMKKTIQDVMGDDFADDDDGEIGDDEYDHERINEIEMLYTVNDLLAINKEINSVIGDDAGFLMGEQIGHKNATIAYSAIDLLKSVVDSVGEKKSTNTLVGAVQSVTEALKLPQEIAAKGLMELLKVHEQLHGFAELKVQGNLAGMQAVLVDDLVAMGKCGEQFEQMHTRVYSLYEAELKVMFEFMSTVEAELSRDENLIVEKSAVTSREIKLGDIVKELADYTPSYEDTLKALREFGSPLTLEVNRDRDSFDYKTSRDMQEVMEKVRSKVAAKVRILGSLQAAKALFNTPSTPFHLLGYLAPRAVVALSPEGFDAAAVGQSLRAPTMVLSSNTDKDMHKNIEELYSHFDFRITNIADYSFRFYEDVNSKFMQSADIQNGFDTYESKCFMESLVLGSMWLDMHCRTQCDNIVDVLTGEVPIDAEMHIPHTGTGPSVLDKKVNFRGRLGFPSKKTYRDDFSQTSTEYEKYIIASKDVKYNSLDCFKTVGPQEMKKMQYAPGSLAHYLHDEPGFVLDEE